MLLANISSPVKKVPSPTLFVRRHLFKLRKVLNFVLKIYLIIAEIGKSMSSSLTRKDETFSLL